MAEYRTTFTVDASPAAVVAYLADLTALPEWDSSVRSSVLASDTGPAVGRSFDVTVGFYGRELGAVYTITEFAAAARVAWSIAGKANGMVGIDVTEDGSGSRVDYHLDVRLSGVARLLDRGLNVALEGIGENVEQGLTRHFAA